MEAKAIELIDLIAFACRTTSLVHLLMDPSPGGAIPIALVDQDGRRRGRSRQPRRRTSRCLAARLLRREITPCYRTLSTEGAAGPPEVSDMRADDGGGPWPPLPPAASARRFRPAEAAAMVQSCMTDLTT